MKRILFLITIISMSAGLFAQNRVVYGRLTVFNRYPVKNVEVKARKAKTSVRTDSLGRFSIVCYDRDVIQIKTKPFRPVSKKVGPKTDTLVLNLYFIDSKENRKRAVGYGFISKKDLLYAVDHLQQENNDFCNYANIYELLRGRFPGVTVSNGKIYVRGNTNFVGQTQAVIFVNGVETSSIDWLSPCDVVSIDILKDSNAAIYGTRGANGVVLIQTKH